MRHCCLLASALILACPASAQERAADPGPSELVVTGQRDRHRQARTFVDALALPSRNHQLGRVEDGICPLSFGLGEEDSARFNRRIRRVAAAVGVPRTAPACSPNIILFVVPNKQAAIAHWRLKRPDFFDGLEEREIDALANSPGPVAAWQIVHLKGVDRRPVARSISGITDHYVLEQVAPGRIGTRIQLEFFAAFVVIEASALREASLVQLADYVAMRSFANTDPAAAAAQTTPTILSLFEPGRESSAPLSVTRWDLSFLEALYDARMAARAADQQRAMARLVSERVEDAGKARE